MKIIKKDRNETTFILQIFKQKVQMKEIFTRTYYQIMNSVHIVGIFPTKTALLNKNITLTGFNLKYFNQKGK